MGLSRMFVSRTAIAVTSALSVLLLYNASAQDQTATPQTQSATTSASALFKDLYNQAQAVVNSPASRYVAGQYPPLDFPQVSQADQNWANFTADHGNVLPPDVDAAYAECVPHLRHAISNAEIGYRMEKADAGSTDAAVLQADAKGELKTNQTQCAQAQQLGGAPTKAPLTGGIKVVDTGAAAGANAGLPLQGNVNDLGKPGFIDWTPALQPLMTYLSNGWNANPSWASDQGTTAIIKLQPGLPPKLVTASGPHADFVSRMLPGAPRTAFPPGSTLRSVEVAPEFQVIGVSTFGRKQMRYYELNGIFKGLSQ
jgi:hypothetical protein